MNDTKASPAATSPGETKKHCKWCKKPAGFITPVGLLCADHAMAATLNQEKGDDRWMPVPARKSNRQS